MKTNLVKNQKGITMIELIVSVCIVGIIVVVMSPLLKQGLDSWKPARARVLLHENLNYAMDFISREIRQAISITPAGAPDILTYQVEKVTSGTGAERKIIFDNANGVLQYSRKVGGSYVVEGDLTSRSEIDITSAAITQVPGLLNTYRINLTGVSRLDNTYNLTLSSEVSVRSK